MGMAFDIIVFVIIMIWFVIYPIILLFKCLFDSAVSASIKILVVITTFILFPIPSFSYGAFIKESKLCKFLLSIYVVLFIGLIIAFLGGFLAGFSSGVLERYGVSASEIGMDAAPAEVQEPATEYRGYNTYGTDDVNVFKSGKAAEEE